MTTRLRTAPSYFVKVLREGHASERLDLSDRVLSFVYEDSEAKADKLVLSVDNWDLKNFDDPVWKKGNLLEVSWGYPGDMAPTRQVVIQKVTGFQTLAVEGLARSVLMNKLARCRTFEHVTRSDVVRQLARENGYGAAYQDIEDTLHVLPLVTQARMTDAQLIRRLADREGFEFYVDFDGLHFHKRRLGQRPVRVLRWFTPPEVGEILTVNIENDVTAKPGAVDVRGRDPLAKKDIHERGSNAKTERDSLAPVIEIVDPETGATRLERRNIAEDIRSTAEPSSPTAKREADARYRRAQHLTVELSATVIGDPSLLAKTVVELQGISQRLSGKYYLKEAKHKIDGSGYTVELKSLRDGHSELGGAPSNGKPNRGRTADNDPDALRPVEVVDPETGRTHIDYFDNRGRTAKNET
ncbi:MAG: contractile injection system protein, VgrG/Pvc8 family [Kofleriaceae bacterium]